MSAAATRCPACGEQLEPGPTTLACRACARTFGMLDGFRDLRTGDGAALTPWPLASGEYATALRMREEGASFKAALETLLLELPETKSERLMQVLREGRGAWLTMLKTGRGRALFVGNALSGAITPLARFGFDVTVIDDSPERLRFADFRNEEHNPGRTHALLADGPRLPFDDGTFHLVVLDGGGLPPTFELAIEECLRVCAGEVLLTGDNRLAYKRPRGPRDEYRLPTPAAYIRSTLVPKDGERTLVGWRRLLAAPGFAPPRAFALYPHAKQFTNVVALDDEAPKLLLGPQERKNRLKLIGHAAGLFPVLTPSFALIGSRMALASGPRRLERILRLLAEHTGEPLPVVEHVLGTRGNSSVIHTRPLDEDDDHGRWTLHVPLCPKNQPQLEVHYRTLELLRSRFPNVPAPEPLFVGAVDGLWLTCERRLRGFPAPQFSGDHERIERTLHDVATQFATLVTRPAAPFTEQDYEEQVGRRIDLAARYAAVESTTANLAHLRDELRERLVGRSLPRVLYHADLRAKHVQVREDGTVVGYLDWGTTEPAELPYLDLFHLVVHERKQEANLSAAEAWKIASDAERLRDYEREALQAYARVLGLDADTVQALEAFYPASVAAMAEKNWDYSRPRWLHRQFGV